jgi:hypothetical protein
MMLGIKALIIIVGGQSYQVMSNQPIAAWHGWLEIWNRWDALHYMDLAQLGYTATGEKSVQIVFFPFYPWVVRLFSFILRDTLVSAFVVSAIASVAAGLLLKRLVELDFEEDVARSSVWFMFIFPTSYFLHIPYTESIFIACILGCLLAARTNHWILAGFLGQTACLSRINGLILVPVLLFELVQQYRATRRWEWQWLGILIVPTGFVAYLLLNRSVTGNLFTFLRIQKEHWSKSGTWPWVGIGGKWDTMRFGPPAESVMVGLQELLFISLGLVAVIWCWRKMRPSYGIWVTLNWLLFVSTSFVLSTPRYMLTLFPIYVLFAVVARKSFVAGQLITVWSLLFLAVFASAFVRGFWAF